MWMKKPFITWGIQDTERGAHPAALAQQLAYAQVRLQEGVIPQARCARMHNGHLQGHGPCAQKLKELQSATQVPMGDKCRAVTLHDVRFYCIPLATA